MRHDVTETLEAVREVADSGVLPTMCLTAEQEGGARLAGDREQAALILDASERQIATIDGALRVWGCL